MIQLIEDEFDLARRRMVEEQLLPRGITDKAVIDAFYSVPRDCFVTEEQIEHAYDDGPLPTIHSQTISQPYMIAIMTQLLELPATKSAKVLEVGTGSGYQAAILAHMGHEVVTIERLDDVAEFARSNLAKLAYCKKVKVLVGDGCLGCPEEAPFDGIIVTAASPKVPEALVAQLRIGGKLIIPCGNMFMQELLQVTRKNENETTVTRGIGCRFVPLIGKGAFGEND